MWVNKVAINTTLTEDVVAVCFCGSYFKEKMIKNWTLREETVKFILFQLSDEYFSFTSFFIFPCTVHVQLFKKKYQSVAIVDCWMCLHAIKLIILIAANSIKKV